VFGQVVLKTPEFDPLENVCCGCPSTYMMHVIINGTFLIRNKVLDTEAFPGRAMRVLIKE
jgi:hypothetical protein